MATDIFVDRTNARGDYAGVFEADENVSYFYLYNIIEGSDGRIVEAVQVHHGVPNFTAEDVQVRWYDEDTKVGVFIKGQLGAYFDLVTGKG